MCLYISQSMRNALHARSVSLEPGKMISNVIVRSTDRCQNIVLYKSAQQRKHVDAKQQVRNASARNKFKCITKQDTTIYVHSCFVFFFGACCLVMVRVRWELTQACIIYTKWQHPQILVSSDLRIFIIFHNQREMHYTLERFHWGRPRSIFVIC